jgi:hypothetical protein
MSSTVLFEMNDVLCRYGRDLRVARLARSCARTPSFVDADALAETLGRVGSLREDEEPVRRPRRSASRGRSTDTGFNAGRAAGGLAI